MRIWPGEASTVVRPRYRPTRKKPFTVLGPAVPLLPPAEATRTGAASPGMDRGGGAAGRGDMQQQPRRRRGSMRGRRRFLGVIGVFRRDWIAGYLSRLLEQQIAP